MNEVDGPTVALLRHFKDAPDTDGKRDPGIADPDVEHLDQTVAQIATVAQNTNKDRVVLLTSPLKRAIETDRLIAKGVRTVSPNLQVETIRDERLAALNHGVYNDVCTDESERSAWMAYVDQTFVKGNPIYRHGDPMVKEDGSHEYPDLLKIFSIYGESQWEFSRRLYSFWNGLSYLVNQGGLETSLIVLCSHTAIIMRTLELASLARRQADVPVGNLYLAEWEEVDAIMDHPLTGQMLRPGGFGVMEFGDLLGWEDRIDQELKYLRVTPGLLNGRLKSRRLAGTGKMASDH